MGHLLRANRMASLRGDILAEIEKMEAHLRVEVGAVMGEPHGKFWEETDWFEELP